MLRIEVLIFMLGYNSLDHQESDADRHQQYILRWTEKYRQGEQLARLPVMRKIGGKFYLEQIHRLVAHISSLGGERKRKAAAKQ